MNLGDLVVRKSYGGDVLFRVAEFRSDMAILKGTDYRLLADAPVADLSVVNNPEATVAAQQVRIKMNDSMNRIRKQKERDSINAPNGAADRLTASAASQAFFEVPGKVLHLDGDNNYLRKSMQLYTAMRVPAHGIHAHESQMADLLYRMLPELQPDIVVITGHDGVLKNRTGPDLYSLSSYKNSQNFVNAVRIAREYEKNRDGLIVIAGACQSHFEALLQSGSNFASSPARILIHALDPVYIAIKASYTSIRDPINLSDVIHGTISGIDGVGGIETMGKYRIGMPRPQIISGTTATETGAG
ncbi:sporulation peptidase YabG [Paenibacillus protaetiae]|uniref:Sporulation peptidase YabG n=1 Tax=Paenibacillus protaetiae TaxID=2509456 RepID=A0A4P6FAE2_9BACL|nr:sporulation peptidase YabG [Paenibacillus protaetiae]QAY67468.1 sporulation peptidase YabG [Paenibacillus protaetiae]